MSHLHSKVRAFGFGSAVSIALGLALGLTSALGGCSSDDTNNNGSSTPKTPPVTNTGTAADGSTPGATPGGGIDIGGGPSSPGPSTGSGAPDSGTTTDPDNPNNPNNPSTGQDSGTGTPDGAPPVVVDSGTGSGSGACTADNTICFNMRVPADLTAADVVQLYVGFSKTRGGMPEFGKGVFVKPITVVPGAVFPVKIDNKGLAGSFFLSATLYMKNGGAVSPKSGVDFTESTTAAAAFSASPVNIAETLVLKLAP